MYKLKQGNCLEIMPQIPSGSVDMILCDLPYGTTACKWDTVIPFEPLWAEYKRIIKKNGAIVLFGSQPFTSALVMSNPKWFKHEWIWKKSQGSNFATVKYGPFKEHESVVVFCEGSVRYKPQMQERSESGKNRKNYRHQNTPTEGVIGKTVSCDITTDKELRYPSSVQAFNNEKGLHPTQKPVALCEYLIKTYTNEGEWVLDNCMGSGTTGVAAVNTGRNFIGIEQEEKYFTIAKNRIQQAEQELNK